MFLLLLRDYTLQGNAAHLELTKSSLTKKKKKKKLLFLGPKYLTAGRFSSQEQTLTNAHE